MKKRAAELGAEIGADIGDMYRRYVSPFVEIGREIGEIGDMYRRYVSPFVRRYVSPVLLPIVLTAVMLPGGHAPALRGHVPSVHVPYSRALYSRAIHAPFSRAIRASGPVPLRTAVIPQVIKDDLGRPFPLPAAAPARIVSLAPNITEILFALGLGPRIAGLTRFCDYPPETAALRKIGGLVDPNIEIVRSLDPDLVVAYRGNPLRLVERMGRLGLPVFVLDIGRGLEDLPPLVERIGRVTRTEARAAELAGGLRDRLAAVDAALRGAASRPKVFVLLYGQGLWTCGGESYVDDLIARAGGTNVASALPKKWVLYTRERIIRDDPDVVFILARTEADFAAGRERLVRMPGLAGVTAVRTGRIHELDENAASRFGPRLVDVLARMAAFLHPDRFGGPA